MTLTAPLLIYSLSAGADIGSTEYALAHGGREVTPWLRSREVRIGRGVAAVAGATALDLVLQKRAPRWRWIPRVVIPLVSFGLALQNFSVKEAR